MEDIIEKYGLEAPLNRLRQINEYTFYDSTMTEDGEEAPVGDPNAQMPPMDGDMGNGGGEIPQGQDMNGGDPNGGMMPQDGDPNTQMPPMDNGQQPPMDNPNGEMPPMGDNMTNGEEIEDIEMDVDTEQPGDEVVDVDDLTQSQEVTEFKLDDVDKKLNKVMDILAKFTEAIEANDGKIAELKKEFEKRNPTAEETLNLRSMAAYPYSERPDDYWRKQQETHPNYRIISDNDVPTADEQKEFEIRKSDIDDFNEKDIMKSLGEGHIKLSDFLGF